MQVLPFNDLIDVPWKNRGGITRDIAKGLKDGHPVWRISRADVAQDGAFSNFAGLTRVLTVVSGNGMVLKHPGGELSADPLVPVRFDGALDVSSRLKDGPLTDLNLMFDPKHCTADVIAHKYPFEQIIEPPEQGIIAFHVLSGRPEIAARKLATGDTAFLEAASAPLTLGKGDAVLEICIRYLDQSEAIKLSIADR